MHRTRIAALLALAVLAAPACARTTTGVGTPQANADPTTAPSAPSGFPAEKIDTLLLSLDQVNKVVHAAKPLRSEDPLEMAPEAAPSPPGSPQSAQCWNAIYLQDFAAKNPGWKTFRSLTFVGTENSIVEQGLTVYPDRESALAAFKARVAGIQSCGGRLTQQSGSAGAISFEVSIENSTDDRLAWTRKLVPGSPADYSGTIEDFRIMDNALVSVSGSDSLAGFVQIGELADSITKKIH